MQKMAPWFIAVPVLFLLNKGYKGAGAGLSGLTNIKYVLIPIVLIHIVCWVTTVTVLILKLKKKEKLDKALIVGLAYMVLVLGTMLVYNGI